MNGDIEPTDATPEKRGPRIFDSHFHVIDPDYPLIENQGFLPDSFMCDDYCQRMSGVPLAGGAVVSGSFQGFDQSYLIASLEKLGQGFVGVTQVPAETGDDELIKLDRAGVRAVRFNLKRGGSESVERMEEMAIRVHRLLGWHVELYVDSMDLDELSDVIRRLPAVSIDHLGLSAGGFGTVLKLVECGVRVKATGFGRVDFPVLDALRKIHEVNPTALMFGTDLPSTRAPVPYSEGDLQLIIDHFPEDDAEAILCKNALDFYRLTPNGCRN